MNEGWLITTLHGLSLGVSVATLGLVMRLATPVAREWRIYRRMKERMNQLWRRHCTDVTGDDYVALEENGKH